MTTYSDLTGNMEFIEGVTTPERGAVIELYKCRCGFHLGVDSTYLEQVGDIHGFCPSCSRSYIIEGYNEL